MAIAEINLYSSIVSNNLQALFLQIAAISIELEMSEAELRHGISGALHEHERRHARAVDGLALGFAN